MNILRVKKTNDAKIFIEYSCAGNSPLGGDDRFSLTCGEPARPEFYEALQALAPHVAEICELPETCVDRIIVTGVSFSYKADVVGATISAKMRLEKIDAVVAINTPHMFEKGPLRFSEECAEVLSLIEGEARRYICGDRAQAQLFEEAQGGGMNG